MSNPHPGLVATSAHADALSRLLEIALELGTEHDLDDILRIATAGVCQAVKCDRASLFVFDDRRQELYTRVVTELEIAEIRHPLSRGIVGWVATQKQMLSVPIPANDDRWDSSVDRKTGFKTLNILAAPVISPHTQKLLGVLQLLNKTSGFDALDEQLVQAFAAHVAVALERRMLQDETRHANELRQALEMGRKIQSTLLPKSLPTIPGYDVAAWWQPAEFVSGDYYDWLPHPDGRWGFTIGDVSGHGLAAALIMASVRAMARVLSKTVSQPRTFVETLRDSITPDLPDGRFISFLFVTLDPATHQTRSWNAGHAPALHFHAATNSFVRLEPTCTPLGFPSIELPHHDEMSRMGAGDLLILGTDGLIEVRNPDEEMFGTERLMQLVRRHSHLSAQGLVEVISEEICRFHDRPLPPDDTTLVIIRRIPTEGQDPSAEPETEAGATSLEDLELLAG